MSYAAIGHNIDNIRKARKITKTELAELAGTTISTVSTHIETGRMNVEYLVKYAEALGCTIADLTDRATDPKKFELPDGIFGRYPWNLAAAVGNIEEKDAWKLFEIYVPALMESLKSLTEREQKVLEMRFKHFMTLEEAGKGFGVTRDRIRQIEAKAIRKLRNPRHWKSWKLDTMGKYIEAEKEASGLALENINLKRKLERLGLTPEQIKEPERTLEPVKASLSIEDLELSVRSYNCLKRAGINTLKDLTEKTYNEMIKVRNLGRKSLEEVIKKMAERGVSLKDE